jgi:hypothetical protein
MFVVCESNWIRPNRLGPVFLVRVVELDNSHRRPRYCKFLRLLLHLLVEHRDIQTSARPTSKGTHTLGTSSLPTDRPTDRLTDSSGVEKETVGDE